MKKNTIISLTFAVLAAFSVGFLAHQSITLWVPLMLISAFTGLSVYHGSQLIYLTGLTLPILLKSKYKFFWITRTKYFYFRIIEMVLVAFIGFGMIMTNQNASWNLIYLITILVVALEFNHLLLVDDNVLMTGGESISIQDIQSIERHDAKGRLIICYQDDKKLDFYCHSTYIKVIQAIKC